jgi:hypothetical protein
MRRVLVITAGLAAFGGLASTTLGQSNAAPPITIEVASPVEATDASGADVSYDVKSHAGLDVTCTPVGGPGQNFTATAHFPLGTTTISCSDGTNTKTADVTVQDTTPPTVSVPSGATGSTTDPAGTATVSWPDVTASDTVDGTLAASCNPPSGSSFPIGSTTVTCSATDSHANTGSAGFTVTVTFTDGVPPTFTSVPSPPPVEATSTAGATVTYSLTASDNSGVPPTINCDHPSGSVFPLGTTTVTCTATDGAGNSANTSFAVTVQDTTPPTLNLPGNISVETESPAGAAVSYTATASDTAAGPIAANCSPPSGATFPVGQPTTVNCSADDGHGHTVTGSFSVTVTLVDHTAPALTNVPANRTVEANGPGGSVVNYVNPTATDTIDGPIAAVGCAPASGSVFPLGQTTVTCSATDAHGNTGTAAFQITIADTVPPTLIVPAARSVYATSAEGISESDPAITGFVSAASASDLVDPHPVVTTDLHSLVPVGVTQVTFIARDASGNATSRQVPLTVLPMPPAGTPPLPVPPATTPPQDVRGLKAEPGDGQVRLSWQIPSGVDHVIVWRSLSAGGDAQVVYTGKAESFTDRTAVNGLEYRYLVVSVNAQGDMSAGAAVVALPKASLLRSPKDGARLKKPPKLVWVKNPEATYYNVQLYRGSLKILSAWPSGATLALKRTWKYQSRKYGLTPGIYRWYVWPGFGRRDDVDYGELLGFSSFQIIR